MSSKGRWIQQQRRASGLNKAELAEKIGVGPASVGQWEDKGIGPGPENLRRLEKFFGSSYAEWAAEGEWNEVVGDVGEWIREQRHEKDWSQSKLGKKIDRTQGTISQWENGIGAPDDDQLRLLEKYFGFQYPGRKGRVTGVDDFLRMEVFDPYRPEEIPEGRVGVYLLFNGRNLIFDNDRPRILGAPTYVGKTSDDLKTRFYNHNSDAERGRKRWFIRRLVEHGVYIKIEDESQCTFVEKLLITMLRPIANRKDFVSIVSQSS